MMAGGRSEPMLRRPRGPCHRVDIRVRDNGGGISEDGARISSNRSSPPNPPARAPGLAFVVATISWSSSMAGQLIVDSRPNEFTEFRIILPRRLMANEGARA